MGGGEAVMALGSCHEDAALVVPALTRALIEAGPDKATIIALGSLGREARDASFLLWLVGLLGSVTGDEEIELLANWACAQTASDVE